MEKFKNFVHAIYIKYHVRAVFKVQVPNNLHEFALTIDLKFLLQCISMQEIG